MHPDASSDQDEVFALLADPRTHGRSEQVIRIDTHGAAVFLAGADVYKVKRAVRFPFMDFSTLEKRRAACENEIAVNRANAPDLYLGVLPVTRSASGLVLGGEGPIVEWVVHMRRFDEKRTLDRLADAGRLEIGVIGDLARSIEAAHRAAPVATGKGTTAALRRQMLETLEALAETQEVFESEPVADLRQAMCAAFAQNEALLQERERLGHARRCHGDLHLGNIVMIEGSPVLFDAIEFDDEIATCDILYDLAFLQMDLWTRDLPGHANRLLNRYLWICRDIEDQLSGLAALPLFLSLRAAIRAKVTSLQPGDKAIHAGLARHYLDAARLFLAPFPLELVAIGGLSGTGKSALAEALSSAIGRPPGAVHLRSDIERKRLEHKNPLERLPDSAYRPEISAKTYDRLRHLAALALRAGQAAVLDATHRSAEDRAALRALAERYEARFTGLWLEAPAEVRQARVFRRESDASDATVEIAALQEGDDLGAIDWVRLDVTGPLERAVEAASRAIRRGPNARGAGSGSSA